MAVPVRLDQMRDRTPAEEGFSRALDAVALVLLRNWGKVEALPVENGQSRAETVAALVERSLTGTQQVGTLVLPSEMPPVIKVGQLEKQLEIDRPAHTCVYGATSPRLTPVEFNLLVILAGNIGRVVTYQELGVTLFQRYTGINKLINVHVNRLRAKLGIRGDGPPLETVRGVGYRYVQD